MQEQVLGTQHPLEGRLFSRRTFSNWKGRLEKATEVDEMVSLLYGGFRLHSLSHDEENERLIIYLSYADGGQSNPANEITEKAFAELSRVFTLPKAGSDKTQRIMYWLYRLSERDVFGKFLWFFDPKRNNIPPRFSRSQAQGVVAEFLETVLSALSRWGDYISRPLNVAQLSHYEESAVMWSEARTAIMDIMERNGTLRSLHPGLWRKGPTRRHLKHMACRSVFGYSKVSGPIMNDFLLAHALKENNQAAWILAREHFERKLRARELWKERNARRRERKTTLLSEVREAEVRLELARRRVAGLS